MVSVKSRATCLLLLLLSTTVLQVAEAASKKEREDALSAGERKKAKKGAGGQMSDGTNKSQKFAESLNKLQSAVGERELQEFTLSAMHLHQIPSVRCTTELLGRVHEPLARVRWQGNLF